MIQLLKLGAKGNIRGSNIGCATVAKTSQCLEMLCSSCHVKDSYDFTSTSDRTLKNAVTVKVLSVGHKLLS